MAHEVEWMVSGNRQVPWHKVGTVVDGAMTAMEALTLGGLDWEVVKEPIFIEDGIAIPGKFATVRSSDRSPLGVVGSVYKPLQNRDAFAFVDALVASEEAKYETAGSLRGGSRVFMTCTIPIHVMVGGKDQIEGYLLLTNSHDGSSMVTAAITPVRVVCMNTLRMALKQKRSSWEVRHTGAMEGKLAEARKALGISIDYMKKFEEVAEELYKVSISSSSFKELLEGLEFPIRAIAPIMDVFDAAPNLEEVRGTRWAAYNAVAEWHDWGRKYRTSDSQVSSVLYGGSTKNKVLAALLAS